jgi:hypothetical protein
LGVWTMLDFIAGMFIGIIICGLAMKKGGGK